MILFSFLVVPFYAPHIILLLSFINKHFLSWLLCFRRNPTPTHRVVCTTYKLSS